jgi:hypothetical protein
VPALLGRTSVVRTASVGLVTKPPHRPRASDRRAKWPQSQQQQPPPQQPQGQAPSDEEVKSDPQSEWLHSEERTENITNNERWIMRISVASGALAILMFTWTKWEVERQLKELPEEHQKSWRAGTYQEDRAREAAERERRAHLCALVDSVDGYVAAEAFDGPRQGFVFKAGKAGLGYYPDVLAGLDAEGGAASGATAA